MSIRALAVAGLWMLCATAVSAQDNRPLSAIDWLSESVTAPRLNSPSGRLDAIEGVSPEAITVSPLGAPSLDAVGLLPPSVTGLPDDLWGPSSSAELADLIRAQRVDTLPAVQSLLYTLLLAELAPPADSNGDGALLLARLDKLLDLGALEQAQALLERAGPTKPELFRRWFDVSLLTGHENRACAAMRAAPGIAPTFPARIFCLARDGDWNAAALSLETGHALGYVSEYEYELLLRFLDHDFVNPESPLPAPARPSPLVFRILEAIGEPLPTGHLPLAFAQADLRSTAGWKAQIEAAERLARAGAISANRLLGIYTMRQPAASGGIWDRVRSVQDFDVAILSGEPDAISETLPGTWRAMQDAELEVPFAALYGERLSRLPLTGPADQIALRIGLLSEAYEQIATDRQPRDDDERFLIGLALGEVSGVTVPGDTARAASDGFSGDLLSLAARTLIDQGRLGEVVLQAISQITEGARGDLRDVSEGLAILRRLGLEDTARRTALQLVILGRRG